MKAKQAARSAEWNAKWDASEAASQKRDSDAAEQKRRADLYPELLAALQSLYDQMAEYIQVNHLDGLGNQSMKAASDALLAAMVRAAK